MAEDGLKLSEFYVSASVSSASRAGLLTGRLNCHNGVGGVFFPDATGGLPPREITMAEALRSVGYSTACIGKWHLGDREQFMPLNQGFDLFYGIPYSNDMYISSTQEFASDVTFLKGYDLEKAKADQAFVAKSKTAEIRKSDFNYFCPLMLQDKVVEYPCDQATLTRRYFDKAIEFIGEQGDKPFFTYITPAMPHIPLYASEQFSGTSARGLYGDVVEEIDWNVGRLMSYLSESGLDENTIVLFASDNGPWLGQKANGGSAGPFRDGKFSHYEGGVRVPFIVKWCGVIPAGSTSDAIASSIDLFPTIMSYAGYDWESQESKIDGIDVSSFWENPEEDLRDEYLYVKDGKPFGIRVGDWIYLPKSGARFTPEDVEPELFNIKMDPSQSENLYSANPEIVAKLKARFESYK